MQEILKLSKVFGWIKLVPEENQAEAELLHDEWLRIERECERERYKDVQLMRKEIREWEAEPEMVVFAKAARLRYLKKKRLDALEEFQVKRDQCVETIRILGEKHELSQELLLIGHNLDKKIRGYEVNIAVLEGRLDKKNLITDEMIERAREYDIKTLLEIGPNGRAKCVFHDGEQYNMDIRKNFAHCYVCGDSGDSITIFRKKNGASFREAIIGLQ